MLDSAGKLLEKLLDTRLKSVAEANGLLAANQYGFRRGKSTLDAIRHITSAVSEAMDLKSMVGILLLDIKNAFNSASWRLIAESLRDKGVPSYINRILDDYFDKRALLYEAGGDARCKELTAGVPQGSVLGPSLWNFMYDGLLRLPMPGGVELVAYADDIALMARR